MDQSPTLTTSTWLQSCLLLTLLLAIILVFSSFRESLSNGRCMSLFTSASVLCLTHVALVWNQHPGAFWNSSISTEDTALNQWNNKLLPIPGLIRMPMENMFFNKPRAIHSYVLLFNCILLYELLLTSYKLMSAFFYLQIGQVSPRIRSTTWSQSVRKRWYTKLPRTQESRIRPRECSAHSTVHCGL